MSDADEREPSSAAMRIGLRVELLWRRGFALVVGGLLPWALLVQFLSIMLLGQWFPEGFMQFVLGIAALGIVIALNALWGSPGQNPMQRFIGLQVIGADGHPLQRKQMAIRNLLQLVNIAPLFLGYAWAAFGRDAQSFADKIAKTRVRLHAA